VAAARAAFEANAEQLGQPIEQVASGYHDIAITHMATAIEKVSLGRGYDPRDFTVIGYGGGSGLFIAEVCRDLGIEKLVMPRAAATFSAYGLLFADAIHSEQTTAQWIYEAGSVDGVNSLYEELERKAVEALRHEGYADADIEIRREADVKFAGQSFEISMTWPAGDVAEGDRERLAADFVAEYERVYGPGSAWDGFPIELHTARVVGSGKTVKPPLGSLDFERSDAEPVGERKVILGEKERTASVYDGAALVPGQELDGLAIVDDVDTTLLVPEGAHLQVDGMRNYVFSIEPSYKPETGQPTATTVAG